MQAATRGHLTVCKPRTHAVTAPQAVVPFTSSSNTGSTFVLLPPCAVAGRTDFHQSQQQAPDSQGAHLSGSQPPAATQASHSRHRRHQQNSPPAFNDTPHQSANPSAASIQGAQQHTGAKPRTRTDRTRSPPPLAGAITKRLCQARDVQRLAWYVNQWEPHLDAAHISTAAWRLIQILTASKALKSSTASQAAGTDLQEPSSHHRLSTADRQAVNQLVLVLLRLSTPLLHTFHPTSAITTLWTLAKLQDANLGLRLDPPFPLNQQGTSEEQTAASDSNEASLSLTDTAWPPEMIGAGSAQARQHVMNGADRKQQVFDPSNVSHQALLTHVCTCLGQTAAAAVSQPAMYQLRPSYHGMLTWAAAVLRLEACVPELWPALITALRQQADSFTARDACATAWAIATADQYDPVLFDMIIDRAGRLLKHSIHSHSAQMLPDTRLSNDTPIDSTTLTAGASAASSVLLSSFQPAAQRAIPAGPELLPRAARAVTTLAGKQKGQPLNSQDLSQLVWSFSRVGHPLHQLMPDLEVAALKLVPQMSPQHMANIAWGLAMQRIRAPRLSGLIFSRAAGMLDQLEMRHIAQLAWAAAKQPGVLQTLDTEPDADWAASSSPRLSSAPAEAAVMSEMQLLAAFAPVVAARMEQVSVQDGVLLAWAYTRARVPAQALLISLAGRLTSSVWQCDHQGLAILLWVFVTQRVWDEALYDSLLTALSQKPLEQVQSGCLQMAVWALGHLAEAGPAPEGTPAGLHLLNRHRQLTQRLAVILHSRLSRCSGRALSNLAWAFAQVGHSHSGFFEDIAISATRTRYTSQEVPDVDSAPSPHAQGAALDATDDSQDASGVTAGSVAELGQAEQQGVSSTKRVSRGMKQLRYQIQRRQAARHRGGTMVQSMNALECAKLVWAFAKVGHVDEELFGAVSLRMCYLAKRTRAGEVISIGAAARTMWAFAMQGMHGDRVLGRLIPCAGAALDLGQPRDVAAIMWALASAGRLDEDEQLTSSCIAYAARHAKFLTGSHMSDVMLALGTTAKDAPALFEHLADTAASFIDHVVLRLRNAPQTFRVSELSNIMWSLVQLQRDEQHLAQHVAHHVAHVMQRLQQHTSSPAHVGISSAAGSSESSEPGIQQYLQTREPDAAQTNAMSKVDVQGWEPEHLVLLVYSLASMGHFHPGLFSQIAQSLMSELDVLDTEHLVLLVWAFASTLHLASAAGVEDVQGRLLAAAEEMLEQVAPPSRPSALTLEELHLLWQSHQCCQLWAVARSQSVASKVAVLDQARGPASTDAHSSHEAAVAPYQLHPRQLSRFHNSNQLEKLQAAKQRVVSQVVHCLKNLRYSVAAGGQEQGQPGAGQVEQVLAGCGQDWLIASKDGKLGVALSISGKQELVKPSVAGTKALMGQHLVKAHLLRSCGYSVTPLSLDEWTRLKTTKDQVAYLQDCINTALK